MPLPFLSDILSFTFREKLSKFYRISDKLSLFWHCSNCSYLHSNWCDC